MLTDDVTQCSACGTWGDARTHRCPARELPLVPAPIVVLVRPAEPPVPVLVPVVRPTVGLRAEADCQELATWLSELRGRAIALGGSSARAPRRDRADHVDAQHEGLDRARCVIDRLAALAAAHPLAALALYACRVRAALEDEDAGLLLAEPLTRRAWLSSEKAGVRTNLPKTQGKALLGAAREAYEAPELEVDAPSPPGFLDALEAQAAARTAALAADRAAASTVRARASALRKIAGDADRAGDARKAESLRAFAAEVVAAWVEQRPVRTEATPTPKS